MVTHLWNNPLCDSCVFLFICVHMCSMCTISFWSVTNLHFLIANTWLNKETQKLYIFVKFILQSALIMGNWRRERHANIYKMSVWSVFLHYIWMIFFLVAKKQANTKFLKTTFLVLCVIPQLAISSENEHIIMPIGSFKVWKIIGEMPLRYWF